MARTPVVTCFLRNRGEVLLFRRAEGVDTYPGRWGGVSGYVEDDDPLATARMEIEEETGIAEATHVRSGTPFAIREESSDREWRVHPFLFDVGHRSLTLNEETAEADWTSPTEIFRRKTVPALEISYSHVAPTVETVETDTERGSAAISVTALEVLRDSAGWAASVGRGPAPVRETASALLDARPTMAVLRNRINRVMADTGPPADIERSAIDGIDRAFRVDRAAATEAAAAIGDTVLTLSRSGTVRRAVFEAEPAVVVAESRPAGEGIGFAESLANAGIEVTVCTDAAVSHVLAERSIDTVLVGADTVRFDGTVVNKTGTRGAALAAANEGIPFLVACSVDKISHEPALYLESGDPTAVYAGDSDITVDNPTFDLTPASLVDAIVTDRGRITTGELTDIAEEMADLADWQEQE